MKTLIPCIYKPHTIVYTNVQQSSMFLWGEHIRGGGGGGGGGGSTSKQDNDAKMVANTVYIIMDLPFCFLRQ